ncbi:transposase [Clostridium sp. DL-VIII]|uniref:IS110 family transposase n=1 Tax=Clostridium sp. DL-VIII TaxID=641107 RepID=UPI0009FBACBF|nr:transposase [Clostridium sp. DL-VIII]
MKPVPRSGIYYLLWDIYHKPSVFFSNLAPFSIHVYCLNPKELANYKNSFNSLDKNHGIDSVVIADFARVGRINIQPWRVSQYLALQRLTHHRLHITEYIARKKTWICG